MLFFLAIYNSSLAHDSDGDAVGTAVPVVVWGPHACPVSVGGDQGLNWLAGIPVRCSHGHGPVVLYPHPANEG